MTQQQAVRIQLEAYKHVLMLLRMCNLEECEGIVRLLKMGDTLNDAVVGIVQNWQRA
jgi:hypothetical protein